MAEPTEACGPGGVMVCTGLGGVECWVDGKVEVSQNDVDGSVGKVRGRLLKKAHLRLRACLGVWCSGVSSSDKSAKGSWGVVGLVVWES